MTPTDSRWPAMADAMRADHDSICKPEPMFASGPRASTILGASYLLSLVVIGALIYFEREQPMSIDAEQLAAQQRAAAMVTKRVDGGSRVALYSACGHSQILTGIDRPECAARFIYDDAVAAESEFGALESADQTPSGWVERK